MKLYTAGSTRVNIDATGVGIGTDSPDYLVDVTSVMAIKVRSILAHESQMGGRTEAMVMERYRKRMIEERGAATTVHGNKDDEVRYQESFKVIEFA